MKHWNQSQAILTVATIPLAILIGWFVYKKSKDESRSAKQCFNDSESQSNIFETNNLKSFSDDSDFKIEESINFDSMKSSKKIFAAKSDEVASANSSVATIEIHNKLQNGNEDIINNSFDNSKMFNSQANTNLNSSEKSNLNSENVFFAEKGDHFCEPDLQSNNASDFLCVKPLNNHALEQKNDESIQKMHSILAIGKTDIKDDNSFSPSSNSSINSSDADDNSTSSLVKSSVGNNSTLLIDSDDDDHLLDSNDALTKKLVPTNQCKNGCIEENFEADHDSNQNNNNSSELNIEVPNIKTISSSTSFSDSFEINSKSNSSSNDQQNAVALVNGNQQNGWDNDSISHAEDEKKNEKIIASKKLNSLSKLDFTDKDDSTIQVYVEFPSEKVGLLIGKQGRNIKQLKQDSGADVYVHTAKNRDDIQVLQICGTQQEIESCVSRIKRRFNDITLSPFDPVNINSPSNSTARSPLSSTPPPVIYHMPNISQLRLPDGIMVDVYVSAIASPDCVFLQRFTHPTFQHLANLERAMHHCYSEPITPNLPKPMQAGLICAAPHQGLWYRAQIVQSFDDSEEVQIKFMDHGGYATVPDNCIKQIRADFVTLPFQAIECYLDNIVPPEGDKYSDEAVMKVAEILKDGRYQARITGATSDGHPKIHLFKCHGNKVILVNREITTKGWATWSGPAPIY